MDRNASMKSAMAQTMSPSEILLENMRLCSSMRGWDRATKKLLPTLTRSIEEEAWGFSITIGSDIGDNSANLSGVVAHRNDKGIWVKVCSVKEDSPASKAGIRPRDSITRINGQIVFHSNAKDVERLIRNSGKSLLLDIERDGARSLMYDSIVNTHSVSFLYNEYNPILGPYCNNRWLL